MIISFGALPLRKPGRLNLLRFFLYATSMAFKNSALSTSTVSLAIFFSRFSTLTLIKSTSETFVLYIMQTHRGNAHTSPMSQHIRVKSIARKKVPRKDFKKREPDISVRPSVYADYSSSTRSASALPTASMSTSATSRSSLRSGSERAFMLREILWLSTSRSTIFASIS